MDVDKEISLSLYIQKIHVYTRHLQLNSIVGFSPCLEQNSKYILTVFVKSYNKCLRNNFLKASLCCHDGYTYSRAVLMYCVLCIYYTQDYTNYISLPSLLYHVGFRNIIHINTLLYKNKFHEHSDSVLILAFLKYLAYIIPFEVLNFQTYTRVPKSIYFVIQINHIFD